MTNPDADIQLARIDAAQAEIATAARNLAAMAQPPAPEPAPEPPPAPRPKIAIVGGTVAESAGKFVGFVEVVNGVPFPDGVAFRVQTYLADDASEEDFTPIDTWITPVVGSMKAGFEVPIKQDLIDESDEVFEVWITEVSRDELGNPELEIAVASATVTILDDDDAPLPEPGTPPKLIANPAALMPLMTGGNAGIGLYVEPGGVANPDGTTTLFVTIRDKYNASKLAAPVTLRYWLDGQPLDTAVADPAAFALDDKGHDRRYAALIIPTPADGVHDLTVRLIDGPTSQMNVRGQELTVGTYDGSPCQIPAYGSAVQSNRFAKPVADFVQWAGGTKHPPLPGKPRGVKQVPGLTQSGRDPALGLSLSSFVVEPATEFTASLYDSTPQLSLTRSGHVVVDHLLWQDGHNADINWPKSRLKAERNGARLANMLDGYSTVRFTHGTLAWCISLRGTISLVDLADGSKRAVAGRVFKEDTIPRRYGDFTDAEVTEANYELVGDAADPDHLQWEAPHDIYPCPWDEMQAVFLDSFGHAGFHVDANFVPAKVTKLFGNGQGCKGGPLAEMQVDRPYALVVHPDRRIRFCCTPKAGDAGNSAIFEINAEWTHARIVLGYGSPADGVKRAIRPFWMCRSDDPQYEYFWEHTTGHVKRINIDTDEVTFWAAAIAQPDRWGQIVCDVNGSIGPKGDVIVIGSNTSPGNTQFRRYDRTGKVRDGTFMQISIGNTPQGSAKYLHDSPMHYGWWITIHPVFGWVWMQGMGNTAPIFFRLAAEDDPKVTYDHAAFGWGRSAYDNGTIPGFPYCLRPSFTALRGRSGHSFLPGIRPVSMALDGKDDAAALEWWRDGADGAHKRPEFDHAAGQQMAYFLGYLRDDIPDGHKPPKIPAAALPQLLGWSQTRHDDGSVEVAFTTDKPVWACLSDFRSAVAAGGYATAHRLRLDRDAGEMIAVRLYGADKSEAQTESVKV